MLLSKRLNTRFWNSDQLRIRRKLWLDIHLFLGLFAGAVLVVVAITGSIMVFYVELQELFNEKQIAVPVPPEGKGIRRSLDDIVAAAETTKPEGSRFFKAYYPRNEKVAYKLLYFVWDADNKTRELAKPSIRGDGYYIFVDPYTATVTGKQLWHPKDGYLSRPIVSFLMQLHYSLLLGSTGAVLVGILGAISIISLLTGLILWWPLTGKFRQALTLKRDASPVRLNFDIHKITGIFSFVVLVPILFSGIYLVLPNEINVLTRLFSPVTRANPYDGINASQYNSHLQVGLKPIGFSTAEAIVERSTPSGVLKMFNPPTNDRGVYVIQKYEVVENSRFVGRQTFVIDQYSGEIINIYNSGVGSAGDIFLDWQWYLHSGHAFGWTGRILVILAGIACAVLYVTGVIRWLQKRRARAKQATRLAGENP